MLRQALILELLMALALALPWLGLGAASVKPCEDVVVVVLSAHGQAADGTLALDVPVEDGEVLSGFRDADAKLAGLVDGPAERVLHPADAVDGLVLGAPAAEDQVVPIVAPGHAGPVSVLAQVPGLLDGDREAQVERPVDDIVLAWFRHTQRIARSPT